jgi:hypothetical protein
MLLVRFERPNNRNTHNPKIGKAAIRSIHGTLNAIFPCVPYIAKTTETAISVEKREIAAE